MMLYGVAVLVVLDQCCICRRALFLGGDQHFQRVNHVPQVRAGSVWLEDPQYVVWVRIWFLLSLSVAADLFYLFVWTIRFSFTKMTKIIHGDIVTIPI